VSLLLPSVKRKALLGNHKEIDITIQSKYRMFVAQEDIQDF